MLDRRRLLVVSLLFIPLFFSLFSLSAYGNGQEVPHGKEGFLRGPTVFLLLAAGILIFFIFFAFYLILKNRHPERMNINLSRLPDSFKFLITLSVIILGIVHLLAFFNVYLHTKVGPFSVEKYFSSMGLTRLISLSHVHLFGHLTMYFLVGVVFVLTRVGERLKIGVISLAILGAYLDVLSWWLIKYISVRFETLSYLSGLSFSLGFLFMALTILYELWIKKYREIT